MTPRTLRFYEAEGLIDPIRGPGGSRTYTRRERTRMQLILRGKRFGMSLTEIAEILDMYDGAESSKIRQLERVVSRVGEISDELTARQRDIARTLDELRRGVRAVSGQARAATSQELSEQRNGGATWKTRRSRSCGSAVSGSKS